MTHFASVAFLLTAPALAQVADLEFHELLLDPVGPNASAQVVEVHNRGQLAADLTGWHLVTPAGSYALPAVSIPPTVTALLHLGQAGASTPFDLYLPAVPALSAVGSLAMFRTAQTTNPADIVDFVSWGGGQTAITTAVIGGQWPSPQVSVVPPTPEGHTIAHYDLMTYGSRSAPEAWFRDSTPTLGLPNDGGGIFAGGYGCPQLTYAPQVGSGEEDNRPWLGEQWLLDVGYLPPSPTWLFLAMGTTSMGSTSLDPFGITGCFFEVQPVAVPSWFLPPLSGQIVMPLPNAPAFVGFELRLQGLVLYPGANPAGALVTRVVHAWLGLR